MQSVRFWAHTQLKLRGEWSMTLRTLQIDVSNWLATHDVILRHETYALFTHGDRSLFAFHDRGSSKQTK